MKKRVGRRRGKNKMRRMKGGGEELKRGKEKKKGVEGR